MSNNDEHHERRSVVEEVFNAVSYFPTKVIAGAGATISGVGTIINFPIVIGGEIIYKHIVPRETFTGTAINAIGSVLGIPGTFLKKAGETLTIAAPALGDGLTAAAGIAGLAVISPTAQSVFVKVESRISEKVNQVKDLAQDAYNMLTGNEEDENVKEKSVTAIQ